MKTSLLAIVAVAMLLLSTIASAAAVEADAQKIAQVKAGLLTEARADWWGFNPEDSTKNLQAAIDSGVKKLTIPKMETPWIVNPISLVSDQEIVIEEHTIIQAIRGGFHGKTDHLFSAREKKNIILRAAGPGVILRMHKSDYRNPEKYTKAEWRHTLALYSCENVLVDGLMLMSSGGDGIYISTVSRDGYSKDITIRNCIMDDHYRQGISVISVENLLIENSIMRNTEGTDPQAGIDFEPNAAGQRLVNITMRNCTFENNAAAGVIIHRYLNPDSQPISFKLINCIAINDYYTGFFGKGDQGGEPLYDLIDIQMTNCVQITDGKSRLINDFWKDIMNAHKLPEDEQKILDKLQRMPVSQTNLVPMSDKPEPARTNLPTVRGNTFLGAYTTQGQLVAFTARMTGDPRGMAISITSPSGQEQKIAEKIQPDQDQKVSFTADETGLYVVNIITPSGRVDLTMDDKTQAGLVLLAPQERAHIFLKPGTYYFTVPQGTSHFAARVTGEGVEVVGARLYNAQGKLVGTADGISLPHKFVITHDPASANEIWKLVIEVQLDRGMEDYYLDLLGIPPIFAMDPSLLLAPKN